MATIQTDRFAPSQSVLRLPVFAAENLVMTEMTGPQWRLALVLISAAHANGNSYIIEKPRLEQLSGVTLNTVNKLLAPVSQSRIDLSGHELDGYDVFDSIEYDPGVRGKLVGQIRVTLSVAMGQFLASGRNRSVSIPADELRLYGSVSSIILRMRFAAAFEMEKGAKGAHLRIGPEDVSGIFGSYGRVAVIKRPSTVTGEIVEHVSLSRAGAVLVDPAIKEINANSRALRLKSLTIQQGRKWASIDIEAARLVTKPSSSKPTGFGDMKRKPPGRVTNAVLRNP